jgi:hypothetical protein
MIYHFAMIIREVQNTVLIFKPQRWAMRHMGFAHMRDCGLRHAKNGWKQLV